MHIRDFLRRTAALVTAAGLLGLAGAAHAAYPEQPIKLVVGFPPGGGGDLYGRTIANALAKHIGQAVIVENKGGAGGNIAAESVARARPDGYTLILAMSGNFGSAVAIRPTLPYKVPDDFVPIAQLVETPFGLMVGSQSPIKSARQFVAEAKSSKLSYASTGTGGAAQIVMEMVKQQAGIDVMHVPYRGSGPALNDLYGGQVASFFAPYTPLMGQITGGKLRLLAVSSDKRVPSLPDVPTLQEAGVPGYETSTWGGLLAPAGTPKAVVAKLAAETTRILALPDVRERFRTLGAVPAPGAPALLVQWTRGDWERFGRLVRELGIQTE